MLGVMELVSCDSFVALSWGGAVFGRSLKMKKFSYFPYLTKLPTGLLSQFFFSDPFRMETVIITIVPTMRKFRGNCNSYCNRNKLSLSQLA